MEDSPPVISLTFLRRNGVISAPVIFLSLHSLRASWMAIYIFSPLASSSFGTGTVIKIPVCKFNLSNCICINSAHSFSLSTLTETLYPLSDVKNSGKLSVLNPTTGTPCVSRYSSVLGISNIDLAPAEITVIYVIPSSVKSAEISKDVSAPRCTPPIPPVTKILIPAMLAQIMVAATVVEPFYF